MWAPEPAGWGVLLLHMENRGGETLGKELCQALTSGGVREKCFWLIPAAWISSGAGPAASEHHPGCWLLLLRAWAEPPWLPWRDERLLINAVNQTLLILSGVLSHSSCGDGCWQCQECQQALGVGAANQMPKG